jgi:hypothetical protein
MLVGLGVGVGVGVGDEGGVEEMELLPPHAQITSERRSREDGRRGARGLEASGEIIGRLFAERV